MRTALVTFALIAASSSMYAEAQSARGAKKVASPITDRFAMRATYSNQSIETIFRLDEDNGTTGTIASAEQDLGLDDQLDQGRLELYFRFGERGRLRVDYFKANRYAATTLERTIDFGDETFLVGEDIESSVDFRSLAFTYTYSFFRGEQYEIGVGGGVHLMEAKALGEVPARDVSEDESGIAPFPTLGVDATYRFHERWSVNARAQYFSVSVEDVEGTLTDAHFDVQYRWKPNFAIGLGYAYFHVDVDVTDGDFPGLFNLKTKGPEFFVRASF